MCEWCKKVYTLSNFEAHAWRKNHRQSANIVLEYGRSLLQFQMHVLDNKNKLNGYRYFSRESRKKRPALFEGDHVCNTCNVGGTWILCDHFPSSLHLQFIQIEVCSASCNNFNIAPIYFGWIIVFNYQSHCIA